MLGKLAIGGVGMAVAIAATIAWADSQNPHRPPAPLSVVERAADCIGWKRDVGHELSNQFAAGAVDPTGSVGFARSVPMGYRVSVYVASTGCESQPVNVAQTLENIEQPGVVAVDLTRSHGNNRFDMYSIVEVTSSQPGATRTFILATKQVTVTLGEGPRRPT